MKHSESVIQWQLERMDMTRDENGNWIDGIPTRADAIAVLDELENECGAENERIARELNQ